MRVLAGMVFPVAFLHVVKGSPDALRNSAKSPIDSSVYLTDTLGADGVEAAAEKLETFKTYLEACTEESAKKDMACLWMRTILGECLPDRPDLISDQPVQSIPAVMLATAPVRGPSEIVKRTKAG